jgi:hypothetical protein
MEKRGAKPKGKVKIKWSGKFAYAIGLIVTDGNLSQNGNRISFVSKDLEQIKNFNKSLDISITIGVHQSGLTSNTAHRVQFRDIIFFDFLNKIGLTPAKSKTVDHIEIPDKYFFDFLRGHLDGDGCFYSYWDPRWKSSFMFYLSFVSASKKHIDWLRKKIKMRLFISGHITKAKNNSCYQLKYAKTESVKLLKKIYYKKDLICLSRKRLKIKKILGSIVK